MSSSSIFKNSPSCNVPDLAGAVIDNGRLRLLKKIGRGAWGVVYLASSVSDNAQIFAVKAIRTHPSPEYQRILSREITLHNVCSQYPGVLRIYNVIKDEENNLAYIVTDYCPDGDLLSMILDGKFVGRDDYIKDVFVQVLTAIEACHSKNIYHRDLKPENILCMGKRIVVADFGFATTEQYSTDFRMGSEPFMSPEVRGGLHFRVPRYSTQQADIWALGVVLMNLACGCLPWGKASMNDPQFYTYVMQDRDYLYHTFPISRELNEILKCVFTCDPRTRISLSEFKRLISNVKSFSILEPQEEEFVINPDAFDDDLYSFLLDEDDEILNIPIQNMKLELRPVNPDPPSEDEAEVVAPSRVPPSRPPFVGPQLPRTFPNNRIPSLASGDSSDFVNSGAPRGVLPTVPRSTYESDSDDDDSEGPITPEQRAADQGAAAVQLEEVPDIPGLADGMQVQHPQTRLLRWEVPAAVKGKVAQRQIPVKQPSLVDSDGKPSARRMLRNAARRLGIV